MDVTARIARSDDTSAIAQLAREAIAELTPLRGGDIWSRLHARIEPLEPSIKADIDDAEMLVLAGSIDDAILGYAVAGIRVLHDGELIADLTDLYVTPEARGVSIGENLMNATLTWAREQGCVGIDSVALPGDRETKNFFESSGLKARSLTVHLGL